MKTEYRTVFTATFDTAEERDNAYDVLKSNMSLIIASAIVKRADMTKDEYLIPETQFTEQVI